MSNPASDWPKMTTCSPRGRVHPPRALLRHFEVFYELASIISKNTNSRKKKRSINSYYYDLLCYHGRPNQGNPTKYYQNHTIVQSCPILCVIHPDVRGHPYPPQNQTSTFSFVIEEGSFKSSTVEPSMGDVETAVSPLDTLGGYTAVSIRDSV